MKIVTHSGIFHADEVFAIALLKMTLLGLGEELSIIRTRDKDIIFKAQDESRTFVIDVGGLYQENKLNFDHHQDETMPASNYLILDYLYYRSLLNTNTYEELSNIMIWISDWDINYDDIHSKYARDFFHFRNISNIISGFNRMSLGEAKQDEQFLKAIDFAEIFLANEYYIAEQKILGESIYKNGIRKDSYIIFDEYCPIWKEKNEFIYAIMPNPSGYAVFSKNSSKYPLPDVSDDDNVIFAHKGKFIVIFATLDEAIKYADNL